MARSLLRRSGTDKGKGPGLDRITLWETGVLDPIRGVVPRRLVPLLEQGGSESRRRRPVDFRDNARSSTVSIFGPGPSACARRVESRCTRPPLFRRGETHRAGRWTTPHVAPPPPPAVHTAPLVGASAGRRA